jgi:hypothetical protein
LPKTLYPSNSDELTRWEGFHNVVGGLIGIIGANRSLQGPLVARAVSISTVLFELFKNTHDHARTTANHAIIGHSVRTLYARHYSADFLKDCLPKTRGEVVYARLNPSEQYAWSALQPDPSVNSGKRALASDGLLEISVFDSGPGLAARWHGADTKNLPVEDELAYVLSCLTKGQTTSSNRSRGYGLWNVLQELRALRGFIRIRTNRVHGYREFNLGRDASLKTDGLLSGTPSEDLFDWKKAIAKTPSEYPDVAGTLISVLLPMSSP